MPIDRLLGTLSNELDEMRAAGTLKGDEEVTTATLPASDSKGPRYRIEGFGDQAFIKMNSNSYLGLSLHPELVAAEEKAAAEYGVGPGAVRFISGTHTPHVELERELAGFHDRQEGMIFSSAYATTLGVLVPLITAETVVISDELNHNCIINAMKLARPKSKAVYRHLDLDHLDELLADAAATSRRTIVVTDGVFSMRGDHAPLDEITRIVRRHDSGFEENAVLIVDDSHGAGAFGETGRGTEEVAGGRADLLIATLGKALGVNGGYVVGDTVAIDYLREKAPLYIYSNPITPAEAAVAQRALQIIDSPEGRERLAHLRQMTERFERGLVERGFETIPGQHPVVPLMVRDTARTAALVAHLKANGVLATGLAFPVVPKGDEEIRFQVSAAHTPADIDEVLNALATFDG